MKTNWKPYVFFIVLTEAVGALAGVLTREGTANFDAIAKSPLTPPAIVFPIVWVILFALMGASAARVYLSPPSRLRERGLTLYAIQLAVNFFWSFFFFNLQAYGFSLLWLAFLWVLIVAMIVIFRKIDRTAAVLLVPYLLWVSFAGYLNYAVWVLNAA